MDGNWLSQVDESSPGRGNSMALGASGPQGPEQSGRRGSIRVAV